MSRRALSSALDVSLAFLLISAAVLIVTGVPGSQPNPETSPAGTLGMLSGITATEHDRYAATPIERLSAGALAEARGNSLRAKKLIAPVERILNRTTGNRQVIIRWRPVPDLHIGGQVSVGTEPPPGAAVDTVRTVVPLAPSGGVPSLQRGAHSGFASLADIAAKRIRLRMQRPCRTLRNVRRGGCPALGFTNQSGGQLSSDIEAILRAHWDDPQQARTNLSVATVTVVVRTWST